MFLFSLSVLVVWSLGVPLFFSVFFLSFPSSYLLLLSLSHETLVISFVWFFEFLFVRLFVCFYFSSSSCGRLTSKWFTCYFHETHRQQTHFALSILILFLLFFLQENLYFGAEWQAFPNKKKQQQESKIESTKKEENMNEKLRKNSDIFCSRNNELWI